MAESSEKIDYLDGWRGLAIIFVLLGHFGPAVCGPIAKFGVTLFFVLSGFFMAKLLFIKEVRLDSFFVRRFTRVIPALWVFLAAMVLFAWYVQPTPFHPSAAEIGGSLTFLRTYWPSDISIWTEQWPTGHLWSLNVEEHSYVFLAVVAIVGARFKTRLQAIVLMGMAVVISVALSYFYGKFSTPSGASPWFVRTECAALGIVAAAMYSTFLHHYARTRIQRLTVPALACLILAALIFTPIVPDTRAKTFLMVIVAPLLCAFAINHAAGFPDVVKKMFSTPVLRWFGIRSFSIYLWQQPLLFYAQQTTMPKFVALALALMLATLSFHFVENPLRVRLNAKWERRVGGKRYARQMT